MTVIGGAEIKIDSDLLDSLGITNIDGREGDINSEFVDRYMIPISHQLTIIMKELMPLLKIGDILSLNIDVEEG